MKSITLLPMRLLARRTLTGRGMVLHPIPGKKHPVKSGRNSPLRLGFVPLADCAPLVMARELDLFERHGVDVELHCEIGWATVRDKIIYGELDAAHAPAGMVVAATAGLGSIRIDCLTALIINLNGNAITLSESLWRRGVRDGATLRKEIGKNRGAQKLVFGVVFPFSSHLFILHSWLKQNGIDPARDVQIVVVPPPQMFPNLKAGNLDGYCVGDPWNSLAVKERAGFIAATGSEIADRHPEKVLMVKHDFAQARESEHIALVAAIAEACRFCAAPQNRERILETLAAPQYLNTPIHVLGMSMRGSCDYGHGRVEKMPDFHVFAGGDANEPTPEKAAWVIRSLRESHGTNDPDLLASLGPAAMFRADIFQQATQSQTVNS